MLRLLLSHHQANRKFLSFGISNKAITAHGIDCAVTSLSVTLAVSLGERCHSLVEQCHFINEPGSLTRSLTALPMVLVLEQARLGKRCHSIGDRCHFLSEPRSLLRSVLRTTNGFGFRASACVVDFNVKWRRYHNMSDFSFVHKNHVHTINGYHRVERLS